MAETIVGLYRTEEIRPKGPWRSIEDVEFTTASWVEWFNNLRVFMPIGDIPPADLETMYYQEQTALAVGAGVK